LYYILCWNITVSLIGGCSLKLVLCGPWHRVFPVTNMGRGNDTLLIEIHRIGSVHNLQAIVLSLPSTKQEIHCWDGEMSISASEFSLYLCLSHDVLIFIPSTLAWALLTRLNLEYVSSSILGCKRPTFWTVFPKQRM